MTITHLIDARKSSDNEDIDSKATKATKAHFSEASNKQPAKIAAFSEEDMNKILESIKKNKTPSNSKVHNWKAFAQEQIQGIKVFKKRCYACK